MPLCMEYENLNTIGKMMKMANHPTSKTFRALNKILWTIIIK
jgi:hypothetical protein